MPRNGARGDSDSTDESFLTNRRSYLKAAGATAVSAPLLAGEGAAATERHGISFSNVVDMVDAGADPNGNEPCDGALQSAAGSDTLLKFPSGTYHFEGKNALSGYSNFGILGDGDVTFTVPDDFNDKLLAINYGTGVLLENITVDQSNATPDVEVAPDDGLEIHDFEVVGQGISSATEGGDPGYGLSPMVRSSGGEGMVENLVMHNEGKMGAYARNGVWIGSVHEGTITLRNCNVQGFSGNGVYASRTPGVVQVEGGLYKNNDISQVRIGSSGSYVEGATCETDVSESNSPNPDDFLNGSGIRLESNDGGSGAVIRDCDIRIGEDVNADGGIQIFPNYGSFTIENTRLEFNPDNGYAIRGKSPSDASGDTGGTLRNVSVTGDATGFVGVLIEDRPETTIEGCCIQQTGSGRTGVALDNCDGSRVVNSTINAGAQALRTRNGSVEVGGIEESGTCPAPSLSSSSYDGSSSSDSSDSASSDSGSDETDGEDDADADSSSDDSSGNSDGAGSDDELSGDIDEADMAEAPDDANLVITDTDSAGGRIPYEFTTSGDLAKTGTGGATEDANDDVSGNSADGGVNQWRDAYEYEGELVSLEVDDRATMKLDQSAQTITVMGDDESGTDYSLEVTGTLEHADDSRDPIADDGSSVSGGVGTFRDVYSYSGELISASIEDSVSITTRPETLDE